MTLQHEEAYYRRLREAFNDIFLVLGVDGNPPCCPTNISKKLGSGTSSTICRTSLTKKSVGRPAIDWLTNTAAHYWKNPCV